MTAISLVFDLNDGMFRSDRYSDSIYLIQLLTSYNYNLQNGLFPFIMKCIVNVLSFSENMTVLKDNMENVILD